MLSIFYGFTGVKVKNNRRKNSAERNDFANVNRYNRIQLTAPESSAGSAVKALREILCPEQGQPFAVQVEVCEREASAKPSGVRSRIWPPPRSTSPFQIHFDERRAGIYFYRGSPPIRYRVAMQRMAGTRTSVQRARDTVAESHSQNTNPHPAVFAKVPRPLLTIARRCLLCLLISAASIATAQVNWNQQPFERGKWIGPPGNGSQVGVFRFRRALDLPAVPSHLLVRISADSKFLLLINGDRVACGPSKSDLFHWKFETVDLAPYLKSGNNDIEALVWKYPDGEMVSQISRRVALLAEAENPDFSALDTDANWRVAPATDRAFIRADYGRMLHGYYAAAPGEIIHAADSAPAWAPAQVIGRAALRGAMDSPTPWMLQPDTLPAMEERDDSLGHLVRQDGKAERHGDTFVIPPHTHATLLLDHGTLTTGYPIVSVTGDGGAKLTVTYAEALYDNQWQKGNRDQIEGKQIHGVADRFYLDRNGSATFEPLNWRTWRFVQLDIETADHPLTIDKTSSVFTAYPFRMRAAFEASDPSLARIWNIGWRTARLDAHDTYMDTPYWERLQYVGDTRIQALISYAMANDDRLARQAIDAIDSSRMPEGLTQSRYPSALPQVIPPFSLLWIGMLHDFWWYRNDDAFLRSHLPGSRAVLFWFLKHQKSNGLLDRLPWWDFVDWTPQFRDGVPPQDAGGDSALLTLQMVEALSDAAELERALGDPAVARKYDQARLKASDGIRKLCWDAKRGLYADTPAHAHYSQQTNALAVMLGVAAPAQQPALMKRILGLNDSGLTDDSNFSRASFYFDFYLSRALETAGLGDDYLQTLGPWRKMMQMGLTTWAEMPEPTRSDSHAWSAHPNFDLLRIVAGIKPAKPRFAAVLIEPHPGSLQSFNATYPHPSGPITVTIHRKGEQTLLDITLPKGLPGTLRWHGQVHLLHSGTQHFELITDKGASKQNAS